MLPGAVSFTAAAAFNYPNGQCEQQYYPGDYLCAGIDSFRSRAFTELQLRSDTDLLLFFYVTEGSLQISLPKQPAVTLQPRQHMPLLLSMTPLKLRLAPGKLLLFYAGMPAVYAKQLLPGLDNYCGKSYTITPAIKKQLHRLCNSRLRGERLRIFLISGMLELTGLYLAGLTETQDSDRATRYRLSMVKQYINDHLAESLPLPHLARLYAQNAAKLRRDFLEHEHIPLHQYISQQRLRLAGALLDTTREPVQSIAWMCGFGDVSAFFKAFKKAYDCTPLAYRRRRGN
ncbi:hypothetical protein A9P82_05825 [Arachidicoccus ginsenosidimutans]|nr:hypothetical protein A9P82_05825 [Arachidicoccus sp. BS20]